MQNARGVCGVEPADDIEHRRGGVRGGQRALHGHLVLQRPPGEELHGDDRHAGNLLAPEDVHRVWMAD